jgi:hypothetical protein
VVSTGLLAAAEETGPGLWEDILHDDLRPSPAPRPAKVDSGKYLPIRKVEE